MQITSGIVQENAVKVVVYGPEGIGKSTFAAGFPDPLFSDTEGSTKRLNVRRLPRPTSWAMLMEQVRYLKANPNTCKTYVIDTADWAERLCAADLCAKSSKSGIEDFGYGKGYVYLEEEFGRLLNLLEDLVELGINVVFTAHAQMRKFEQPDEMGAYDRWEMKLEKKTSPLLKEWADIVLFANYKTYVINVDNQGATKGKNKAQGGKRVMYTAHHACWDAKNRYNLPEELDFTFAGITHCIPSGGSVVTPPVNQYTPPPSPPVQPTPPPAAPAAPVVQANPPPAAAHAPAPELPKQEAKPESKPVDLSGIPKALADLMHANNVSPEEIQEAVGGKGYYPKDTPIKNYDPNFVSGVLVSAWKQVFQMILKIREDGLPF